jgi:uncharacterized protein
MNTIKDLLKVRARPKLNEPQLFAAWPGVGDVAVIVATYLLRKLEFKELARLRPTFFFDPIGVMVRNNVVEEPQFPQSVFYYLKNAGGRDLILLMGEAQPTTKSYDMANAIVDAAEHFHVKRIYTCAAAITRIHHTEEPRVWLTATTPDVLKELSDKGSFQGGNLQIAGLNGILLGVAKERKMEGACFLGEVPNYAMRVHNPMAALAIMPVMAKILGIKVELDELKVLASYTRERMKQVAAEAMEEYIDYFTEPIWEQSEDEPEE